MNPPFREGRDPKGREVLIVMQILLNMGYSKFMHERIEKT
jgi:hypothetical protein